MADEKEIADDAGTFAETPKPQQPQRRLTAFEQQAKKIAELEAANKQLQEKLAGLKTDSLFVSNSTESPAENLPHWLVSIPDGPSFVVAAVDAANAEKAYKKAASIISTPHTPTCTLTDAPVGRYKETA